MIQSVNKEFLEMYAKVSQTMAKSAKAGSSQDASFKNYMQEMGNKRDTAARSDNLGKKDVQKPKDKPAAKNESSSLDAANNGNSGKTENDKVVDSEGGKEEDSTKASEAAQNLIDLSALVVQMNDNVMTDGKTWAISNVVVDGVPQENVEGIPQLTRKQGLQPDGSIIIPYNQGVEQQGLQTAKPQETPQVAVTEQVATAKPTEAGVLKPETSGAKLAQAVNTSEAGKNVKANGENTQQPKETISKAGEAKPIEVKVEVNTNQNDAQTGKQAKTEETTDAAVLTAKIDKPEMPTITVKVGDGGQINTQQMAEDVADAIIKKMPQKANEFEIQITPKELGNITIKLLFENGQTLVSLSAGNSKTTGLLAECAKTIGAMIQQHTGNETVVTVQDDKSFTDQQSQEGNRQNAESQQQENAKRQQQHQGASQDFVQQMRLGLIDGDFADSKSRYY